MALNIKNDQTQQLSRELAGLTGETVTTAVTIAVRERLDRIRSTQQGADERAARILALAGQIAALMPPDAIEIDDLYDDAGLPA